MRFSEFPIDALIEWLKSAERGLDPHCKHKCYGEIHLYNDTNQYIIDEIDEGKRALKG